jgi:GDP-L-fucose synthase
MKKTIFLTGSTGFVGKNLKESLEPEYNLLVIPHSELDLTNTDDVTRFFAKNPVDLIIHCAYVGGNRKSGYDLRSVDVVGTNLKMFFNLAHCLHPKMRMINFGSGAEYDKNNYAPKMKEEYFDRHIPQDAYGFSKYVISKYIEKMNHIISLRLFGVFGKYEDYSYKFISNAIVKNLLRLPIKINQNVVFDYLFINDLLSIVKKIIESPPNFKFMNITPTESIDLVNIAKIINEVGEFQSEIQILNPGMNSEYSGSNERLLKYLDSFTFTPYKQSIAELYKYYKSHLPNLDLDIIKQDPYIQNCITSK